MRNARMLAESAYRAKVQVDHMLINGFLIRVLGRRSEAEKGSFDRDKGVYTAYVMDTPGFIFYAGALSLPRFSTQGVVVPVGIRDDFDAPGTQAVFQVLDKSTYFLMPVPTRIRQAAQQSSTGWFPAVQQRDWFLGYSRMDVPVLADFPDSINWYLDDDDYFDYSCNVALTGSLTSFLNAARAVTISDGGVEIGEIATSYFLRNQYAIDESDLPENWKLYPRRLVPISDSAPLFSGRRYPGITMSGFAIIPASTSTDLVGFDLYCHAARTFRQYQEPWGDLGMQGFDRYGEQGMLIAVGQQNRSAYNPETGAPVFAATRRITVVEPVDIAQDYLHPFPEMLPGDESGKPELPNFGTFYTPTPVQVGNDFAIFSAYTTLIDRSDGDPQSGMVGDAWSIITTTPGGENISLRADWNATGGEIETGVPGEFMQPWIVGGASVPGDDGAVAYCLVWEQTYIRGSTERLKGEWAIYSTTGGSPSRSVLSGGAPLFSLWMQDGPTKFEGNQWDVSNPFSSVYHAGAGMLVTACTDYPAAASGRSIKCAVFDTSTNSIKIGGQIAVSSAYLDKCFISVVQPFTRGTGDLVPAVMLATIAQHSNGNDGAGGKSYLSVDGGESWSEYITDAGAQGGAFYVGNKLWKFDLNNMLDGRLRQ